MPLNSQIADRLTTRQIQVARVEAGWRRDLSAALAVLEADILAAIKVADPTQWALLTRRRGEVEALMAEELDPLIAAWYARTAERFDVLMGRLAVSEAAATQRIVNQEAEEQVLEESPPETGLRRRVAGALFPSAAKPTDLSTTGADWWSRQGASLTQRVRDTLQVSVSQDETLTQMTQRVRGTSEQGFRDGVMERARQDAARLLRTQTSNAIGEARAAVGERNADMVLLEHISILDSRTSLQCLGRHGLRYRADTYDGVGHSVPFLNGPPYHTSCRSSIVTIVPNGGPIPQQSVDAWLRSRDTAYQNAVLGPTRARMFRAGKLTSRELIDAMTGQPLTLEDLEG